MEQPKTDKPVVRVRVTILLKDEYGRICFARHCKNGQRYWLLPGGGQKPFETAADTARRELAEELRISAEKFNLLFVRESINIADQRHIQFLVFEGLNPDFSGLTRGDDPRVEGYDFLGIEDLENHKIYPSMKNDLIAHLSGKSPELFKTLEWIP